MLTLVSVAAEATIGLGSGTSPAAYATAEMVPVVFSAGQNELLPRHQPSLRRALEISKRPRVVLMLCYKTGTGTSENVRLEKERLNNVTAALRQMGARAVERGSEGFCQSMSKAPAGPDSTVRIYNAVVFEAIG
jgi:hypothetical protein